MAKRIAPELSALTVERSRLGEQFQDAVRGRPVTAEMHAIVGLNDSLVDLHSRLDSVTAGTRHQIARCVAHLVDLHSRLDSVTAGTRHQIARCVAHLVDLHSRLDSVTAGLAQARTAERRLREAAKRVIAAQSGSAFSVNESINELRRVLEGE